MTSLEFDVHLDGCVVCSGGLSEYERPDVHGTVLRYSACTRCGLVQMDPRPSPEALEAFYEHEYRAAMGDETGEETGDAQQRRATQQKGFIGGPPKRHLDVGSSLGDLLVAVGADQKVGVEPGVQHRDRVTAMGIEVFETIAELTATDPEPFDLITMSHVLEHIDDPVAFLPTLKPLLAPGGQLFVEVPYLYRSIAYTREHLLAFSKPTLASTLRAGGFEVQRRATHPHRQGGLGMGRNLAVMATPTEPVVPTTGSANVTVMQLRRKVGFSTQKFYRWRRRHQRRVERQLKRLPVVGRR